MSEFLRAGTRGVARVLRRTANALDAAAKTQTWIMQHPRRDMAEDLNEGHYSAQYLHWLEPLVKSLPPGSRILDLGCGFGRLALAVAAIRPDCDVVGVDISPPSIRGAAEHAASRGLTNCHFIEGDLAEYLPTVEDDSVDLVLFTEVSFFAPGDLGVLRQSARMLRPGAHIFAAFRSQWFNLVFSVLHRDLESARMVRDARDGRLWNGANRFWWHTVSDIQHAFEDAGLKQIGPCRGIGVLSGIEGDSSLPLPSTFEPGAQWALLDLELSVAESYASQGRYILAIGMK